MRRALAVVLCGSLACSSFPAWAAGNIASGATPAPSPSALPLPGAMESPALNLPAPSLSLTVSLDPALPAPANTPSLTELTGSLPIAARVTLAPEVQVPSPLSASISERTLLTSSPPGTARATPTLPSFGSASEGPAASPAAALTELTQGLASPRSPQGTLDLFYSQTPSRLEGDPVPPVYYASEPLSSGLSAHPSAPHPSGAEVAPPAAGSSLYRRLWPAFGPALPPVLAAAALPMLAFFPPAWLALAGGILGTELGGEIAERLRRPWQSQPEAFSAAQALSRISAAVLMGGAVFLAASVFPGLTALLLSSQILALAWHDGRFDALLRLGRGKPESLFEVTRRGDRTYLDIDESQVGRIFLLSATLERGLGEKGFYSSRSWDMEFAWYFRLAGDSLELVSKNTRQRAQKNSSEELTLSQSTADSLITRARVKRVGRRLRVNADELFQGDLLGLSAELSAAFGAPYALDLGQSVLQRASPYPRNVEIVERLSFLRQGEPQPAAPTTLNDTRRLDLTLRYSLSSLPDLGYTPRPADERLGHFLTLFEDWTDDQHSRIERHLIHRWRLEKTDPLAPASPVKKPITFWLDPTVPPKYKEAVRRGILAWLPAFERLGLLGAIEVKDASEDPEYDPSDVRYNPVRFYIENDSGFAIGPSRVNPLTGEIYQASVSLSMKHPRGATALDIRDLDELAELTTRPHGSPGHVCRAGEVMAREAAMTLDLLEARGGLSEEERRRFLENYMTDLVMHEIGHTLGLRHNFKAGNWLPNARLSEAAPFAASVMDYLPINLAAPSQRQGAYWLPRIGPYDEWAIEYAYTTDSAALGRIAARSSEPGLAFATDEEVDGADPDIQTWDLGSDPLEFARERAAIVRELWASLARGPRPGEDFQALQRAYINGWAAYFRAAMTAARFIGGLHLNRVRAGEARSPIEPVPAARQREALQFLADQVFSDAPFDFPPDVLRAMAASPLGTLKEPDSAGSFWSANDLPLWLRSHILARILDPDVLDRLHHSARLKRPGVKTMSLPALLHGLSEPIFSEILSPAPKGRRGIPVTRRHLHEEYIERLIDLGVSKDDPHLPAITGEVRGHLKWLMGRLNASKDEKGRWTGEARRHLAHLSDWIRHVLDLDPD